MTATSLNDVFGIMTSVPTHTYVDRSGLDGHFRYLLTTDRHIVIYGSSKQGKTSLRRKQLPEQNCVVVPCKPDFAVSSIYTEIRRQLGVRELVETKKTHDIKAGLSAEVKGQASLPLIAKGNAGGAVHGDYEYGTTTTYSNVTAPDSLVALSEVLKQSGKKVIIEDFHYLLDSERKAFAFDLKALWDLRVFVIIIGVWAEQNLLLLYNHDLNGRIEELDVRWKAEELDQVISKGENALSIVFDEPIRQAMIEDSSGNVGLLQRFAEHICRISGIYEGQKSVRVVTDAAVVDQCRDQICSSQESRYFGFVEIVGRGFKDADRTKLKMYRHLIRVSLEAQDGELLAGLDRAVILTRIHTYEPNANLSVLSAALAKLDRLQAERGISPPIFSYNNVGRNVTLVDRELLFFRRHTKRKWPWDVPGYEDEKLEAEDGETESRGDRAVLD